MTAHSLNSGDVLKTKPGGVSVCVQKHLGTGGQGEVYRVESGGGRSMALKWYLPSVDRRRQYRRIQRLINRGAPSEAFLWPEKLVADPSGQGFGYLMELRPSEFYSVVDLMAGRVDPSFRALAKTGMNLAEAFLNLHSRGLCYGDISFGNVFFDPATGDIRICDNDNVVVDGSDDIGVMGTPRFMAPEIVRGEAMPTSDTDRYSLAVLLFYLFMVHHPLEGQRETEIRCLDLPAMERLYGEEPVFIFDPENDANGPVKGVHDTAVLYWNLYPGFLRKLFVDSFTEGLRLPEDGRIRESQWRQAMCRLVDSIMYCDCGTEVFYDVDQLKRNNGTPAPCWCCKRSPELPPRMRVGGNVVVLTEKTRLRKRHLSRIPSKSGGDSPMAVCKTDGKGRVALLNRTSQSWSVASPGHSTRSVAPGKHVELKDGLEIHFGEVLGRVRL